MKVKNGKITITSKVAYIAGFFDGEGCIRIKHASSRGNCFYVWVAITNSNRKILDSIMLLFGGKVRKAEITINKTIYHYLITSSEAVDFLKIITPFLIDKKPQAELAVKFHENKSNLTHTQKMKCIDRITKMKYTKTPN